jgi:hypothetical protein
MRQTIILLLVATAACSKGQDAGNLPVAQVSNGSIPQPPQEKRIFSSIGELTRPDQVGTELRGARIADPSEWTASFYTSSAAGMCTSSLVGDRILLTAAHCVENGAAITLRYGGTDFQAMCERAPGYSPDSPRSASADYALCALDRSIPGIPAERVNSDPTRLAVGGTVLLTGFGCVTNQGTGGNDGIYRVGESQIVALPNANDNSIIVEGRAGLCFGDSGGPAFLQLAGGRRIQISVNSRVQNLGGSGGTNLGPRSYLSSTSTPEALVFLRDWSRRNNLRICGVDPQAVSCRA